MKKLIIILNIFIVPLLTIAQESYSIQGNVKVRIGIDLVPASNTTIVVKGARKGAETDSLGNYEITDLTPGQYELLILGFGYKEKDTILIIDDFLKNVNFILDAECSVNQQRAIKDLRKNKPKLLLFGSIAPVVYPNDKEFEDKYGIRFYDYGCTPPAIECMASYNQVIFDYLDDKYGSKWRKEIRNDVIGLK